MKKCRIKDIKGGEILANPIMTDEYHVLLSEGTVLKPEYISKIEQLGIKEIYIKDKVFRDENEIREVKEETQEKVRYQVKNVLEKHIYHSNDDLKQLDDTAEVIIESILKNDNIVNKIIEIKEKSSDLYEHSITCCVLSTILALRMNLSQEVIHSIGVGCLLHDIGLRFISINYENQNVEELPNNQYIEYKKHPVYGYSSIEEEKWLDSISKNIILYHHEQRDGTGYPLKIKNVLQEIEIVNICDTFDEMISGIGYKKAKIYQAIEYLKTFKNSKFSGTIVDEFLKIVAAYPIGTEVVINTGEKCKVVSQNNGFPERPVLKVIYNSEGKRVFNDKIIDLIKENSIFINDIID